MSVKVVTRNEGIPGIWPETLPRPRIEEHVRRDRVLDAIETLMILDDSAEFRVVARRRYLEITERNDA